MGCNLHLDTINGPTAIRYRLEPALKVDLCLSGKHRDISHFLQSPCSQCRLVPLARRIAQSQCKPHLLPDPFHGIERFPWQCLRRGAKGPTQGDDQHQNTDRENRPDSLGCRSGA